MIWEAASADAIGGRSEQQDRVGVWRDPQAGVVLAVVADGMGGHEGGALAAQSVIDAADEVWARAARPASKPVELIASIIRVAHERINAVSEGSGKRPGSTCVVFYGDDKRTAWGHVGDSRIYHFRGGALVKRSRDHSMVQLLADRGEITEAQMATHPDQNLILQSLGGERDPRPDFDELPVAPGDAFVLCSDGLWEAVSAEEMGKALMHQPLPATAEALVDTAAQRRGPRSDNVSVALVRVAGRIRVSGGSRPVRSRSHLPLVVGLLAGFALGAAATWGALQLTERWARPAPRLIEKSAPPVEREPPRPVEHQPAPTPLERPDPGAPAIVPPRRPSVPAERSAPTDRPGPRSQSRTPERAPSPEPKRDAGAPGAVDRTAPDPKPAAPAVSDAPGNAPPKGSGRSSDVLPSDP